MVHIHSHNGGRWRTLADWRTWVVDKTRSRILNHPRRTEHWSLAALISKRKAQVYEIIGGYTDFSYFTRLEGEYASPEDLRGACQIGDIPADKVDWAGTELEKIPIIHNNPDFDCQNWVLNAISHLRRSGEVTIYPEANEATIRQELKEEDERWEAADDILFERLYK